MSGAGAEDRLEWSYFSLAALPFAIYLSSAGFHARFIDCTTADSVATLPIQPGLIMQSPAAFVAAQYVWGTATIVLWTACIVSIVLGVLVVLTRMERRPALWTLGAGFAVAAVLAAIFVASPELSANCVSERVYELTLTELRTGDDGMNVKDFLMVNFSIGRALGLVAITALAVGGAANLVTAAGPGAGSVRLLAAQFAGLRWILYVGAVTLLAFLVVSDALFGMPLALVPDAVGAKGPIANPYRLEIESLVSGLLVFWGASLTLVLIAIYLPSSLFLRARAHALVEHLHPEMDASEREAWLKANALAGGRNERLTKTVAALSPLIAGVGGSLLSGLVGLSG